MTIILTIASVVLLFVVVRSTDLAITARRSNDVIMAILYGIVAILGIVVAALSLVR